MMKITLIEWPRLGELNCGFGFSVAGLWGDIPGMFGFGFLSKQIVGPGEVM